MISESAGIRYRKLWDHSAPLRIALFKFAHPDLIARYHEIEESRPKMAGLFGGPDGRPIEGDTIWQQLGNMIDRAAPVQVGAMNRDAALGAMKKNVMGSILDGELLALGFEEPRNVEDHPWEIPSEVCRHQLDWDNGKASGVGLSFVEVRLMPAHWKPKLLADLAASGEPGVARSRGRPSVKAYVGEAYETLRDAGRIDFDGPMAALYDSIRIWLVELYPSDAARLGNLSNETIRKMITDRFKEDGNSR